jgi:hypothetical protein
MADDLETFEIPAGIEGEVEVAADVIRDALTQRLGREVDVGVIENDSRGFVNEAGAALLYVPVYALTIISKKWLEDCVWPQVKARVEKPTQKALDFLLGLAPSRPEEGGRA